MSELTTPELLSCLMDRNILTDGGFMTCLEIQRADTVLQAAGVPVGQGDLYCGIHMNPLEGRPIIRSLAHGLAETAWDLESYFGRQSEWEGARPSQIVGVTHWGLARLAVHAGFECVEVDPDIFNAPENEAVGWHRFEERLRWHYGDTERAQRGGPLRVGVVSQPVDTFIDRWGRSLDAGDAIRALGRSAGQVPRPLP